MVKEKIRIDELIFLKGLVESRCKAQALILAGSVICNGKEVVKPGEKVPIDANVEIKESLPYVSRGGLKLESAIKHFQISLENKIAMDVGASTGGFTDCLLKHGAKKVYAIDVGYGILDVKLRNDDRVVNIEKTNIRFLSKDKIPEEIDIAVIDVSFISLTKVLSKVIEFLKKEAEVVALIKPQFELTPKEVGKGGIVKDKELQLKAVEKILEFASSLSFKIIGYIPSPITGKKGNQEFLVYLKK